MEAIQTTTTIQVIVETSKAMAAQEEVEVAVEMEVIRTERQGGGEEGGQEDPTIQAGVVPAEVEMVTQTETTTVT